MSSPDLNTSSSSVKLSNDMQLAKNNYLMADTSKGTLEIFAKNLNELMSKAQIDGKEINQVLRSEIDSYSGKIEQLCNRAIKNKNLLTEDDFASYINKIKNIADNLLGEKKTLSDTAMVQTHDAIENSKYRSISDQLVIDAAIDVLNQGIVHLKQMDEKPPTGTLDDQAENASIHFCRSHLEALREKFIAVQKELKQNNKPISAEKLVALREANATTKNESLSFTEMNENTKDIVYVRTMLGTVLDFVDSQIPQRNINIATPTQSPETSPLSSPQQSPLSSPSASPRQSFASMQEKIENRLSQLEGLFPDSIFPAITVKMREYLLSNDEEISPEGEKMQTIIKEILPKVDASKIKEMAETLKMIQSINSSEELGTLARERRIANQSGVFIKKFREQIPNNLSAKLHEELVQLQKTNFSLDYLRRSRQGE